MKHVKMLFLATLFFIYTSSLFADEVVQDTKYRVLASFDKNVNDGTEGNNTRWIVRGSKFSTAGFPKMQNVPYYTSAYFNEPGVDKSTLNSLGIRGSFDRSGYNYVEIIPVEDDKDKDGNDVPKLLPIPGKASSFDLWVWGSMYNYNIQAEFVDHTGKIYTVDLGNLKYKGWKQLSAKVPSNFKRVEYAPYNREPQISLTRLIIWTNPSEQSTWVSPGKKDNPKAQDLGFYVYIDNLRVLTDEYISPYDGDNLNNADTVNQIWGNGDNGNSQANGNANATTQAPADANANTTTTTQAPADATTAPAAN